MSFLRELAGAILTIASVVTGQWYYAAAAFAVNTYNAVREQKKQQRAATRAFNAAQKDRLVMVDITPDQARSIVLGRVRHVEGVRRRWLSGTNNEQLTLVVSYAGHEIDAFEEWYADDTLLELDAEGYVQTAPFYKNERKTQRTAVTTDGSGGATVDCTGKTPIGDVTFTWFRNLSDNYEEGTATATVDGDTITVSGAPATVLGYAVWEYNPGGAKMRIRAWTGAPGQNVGAELAAEYPGKITSTDKFSGMAVAVIDLWFDQDVYPQGRPNITAVVRGAKVYDPTKDSTNGGSGSHRLADSTTWEWSENSMLLAYHYARHANGWAVPAADIPVADIHTGAAACAVSTSFPLTMPDTSEDVLLAARYRCGTVIQTDGDPRAAMDEIMLTMAGRWGWAGGKLRMRAGVLAATSFTLDSSWVAVRTDEGGVDSDDAVITITNGYSREQRVTQISGTCMNPDERYQLLPFPAVEDPVLIAADGIPYSQEIDYEAVVHPAHAQHLSKIRIREGQAPLRVDVRCNLSAYRCELFDVVELDLPRYGFSGKKMEVTGWSWSPTEGVQLALAEVSDALYAVDADLMGIDPAPNSSLRSPWEVDTITGVAVESATEALSDGSVLTRTRVTWDRSAQQSVLLGGAIEVQYVQVTQDDVSEDDWTTWEERGSAGEAVIGGLMTQRYYLFRVRAVQQAPLVRGPWSTTVLHKIGAPPEAGGSTFVAEFSDETGVFYSNAA